MTRGFASLGYAAAMFGAALGCYLVSLRVAAERAQLESVESRIVLAQRDIRLLQTEIGTRGRLAQLERWNVKVLALSAPKAEQFLQGGFELARMTAPQRKPSIEAPVVLASAPAPAAASPVEQKVAGDVMPAPAAPSAPLLHTASLKQDPAAELPAKPQPATKPAAPAKPAPAAKPAKPKPAAPATAKDDSAEQ